MRLLVACPRLLLLVDAATHEYWVVDESHPGYYGITWTPDGEEMVFGYASREIGEELEDYMDSECGELKIGSRVGVDCLSAPHQILCTDDRILICNTGRNCLTVVRRDDLYFRHIWLDGVRWDRKGPERFLGKHFNSVHVAGDRLLMLAHGFKSGSQIAELTWPGLEFTRWIETKAYQAHNLWARPEGDVLTCNTMQGSVIDAVTGRILWKSEKINGMSRGLACAGKHVFVGMSKFAQRKDRMNTDGGIWVLDRQTWKEIDFIPLPVAGNVREVRVVDEPDECHHGHVLRHIPVPLEGPTAAFRARGAAKQVKDLGPWTAHLGKPDLKDAALVVEPSGGLTVATVAVSAADVSVTARLEAEVAADHRHAGLVARYAGPGDLNMVCALVEVVAPHPYASLWENAGGQWRQLGRARLGKLPVTLRLDAVGTQLTLSADGRKLLTAKTAVLTAGAVGVRGLTGRFDGFSADAIHSGQRRPLFPPPAEPRAA